MRAIDRFSEVRIETFHADTRTMHSGTLLHDYTGTGAVSIRQPGGLTTVIPEHVISAVVQTAKFNPQRSMPVIPGEDGY